MIPSTRQQCFVIRHGHVACPAAVLEPGVLGADPGIVEPGGNGMGLADLPVGILQDIGAVSVQHAHASGRKRRSMMAGGNALARRLDADQTGLRQRNVGVENAHGV